MFAPPCVPVFAHVREMSVRKDDHHVAGNCTCVVGRHVCACVRAAITAWASPMLELAGQSHLKYVPGLHHGRTS